MWTEGCLLAARRLRQVPGLRETPSQDDDLRGNRPET